MQKWPCRLPDSEKDGTHWLLQPEV